MDIGNLPRSRAIVAFDRNGFLLPIEPVTPRDSKAWQVVHLSPVLIAVGVGLFLAATVAPEMVALVLRLLGLGEHHFFTVSVIGTVVVVASYWLFVRVVERRRDMPELSWPGWWREAGAGAAAGVLIYAVIVLAMCLAGGASLLGIAVPAGAARPLILVACAAVVQEILMRGEVFRLAERLLGSMIALAVTAGVLGAIQLFYAGSTPQVALAIALENGVLFGAVFMVTRRLWGAIGLHVAWNVVPPLVTLDLAGAGAADTSYAVLSSWTGIAVTIIASAALLYVASQRSRIVAPAWTRHVVRPGPSSVGRG